MDIHIPEGPITTYESFDPDNNKIVVEVRVGGVTVMERAYHYSDNNIHDQALAEFGEKLKQLIGEL